MKRYLAVLLVATSLAAPAHAFKAATSAPTPSSSIPDADSVLNQLNKKDRYSSDFLRISFLQMMGLVFFDLDTPDIALCQKDILNYHLPQVSKQYLNYEAMKKEIAQNMREVYTAEELAWMAKFYASPFGERMYQKQLDMNDRITRMIAARYQTIKPQLRSTYKIVAERCGSKAPAVPADAPNLSDAILMPTPGSAPLPPSPEPVTP